MKKGTGKRWGVFGWNGEGVLRLNGVGAGEEVMEGEERLGRGEVCKGIRTNGKVKRERGNGGAALGGRAPPS